MKQTNADDRITFERKGVATVYDWFIYMKDRIASRFYFTQFLCLDWTLLSWDIHLRDPHRILFSLRRHFVSCLPSPPTSTTTTSSGIQSMEGGRWWTKWRCGERGGEENDPSSLQLLIGSFSPTSASPILVYCPPNSRSQNCLFCISVRSTARSLLFHACPSRGEEKYIEKTMS